MTLYSPHLVLGWQWGIEITLEYTERRPMKVLTYLESVLALAKENSGQCPYLSITTQAYHILPLTCLSRSVKDARFSEYKFKMQDPLMKTYPGLPHLDLSTPTSQSVCASPKSWAILIAIPKI